MEKQQSTVAKKVSCTGIGLHSGKPVEFALAPAAVNTGIVYVRTDLPGGPQVQAAPQYVTSTMKATALTDGEAHVFTIEHLMAALAMLGIDNCYVEMSSPEPPVLDGSALEFCKLILSAGRVEQEATREIYEVDKPFAVYKDSRYLLVLPYDGYRISFTSMNDHPLLGTQFYDIELSEESFMEEIAAARTVGFMHEIEQMQKMGLGLGGSLENVVVFDDTKVLSELRFENELIRHKILDVIGDLYLLGPIRGHVIAVNSGHAFNDELEAQINEYITREV